MAHECKTFYKRLAQMISEKRSIDCSTATNFVRTKISFSLLRSTLMSIRGSRSFKRDFDFTDIEQSPTSLPIFGRWNHFIYFYYNSFSLDLLLLIIHFKFRFVYYYYLFIYYFSFSKSENYTQGYFISF